jgi:hypothetical protein
MPRLKRTLAIEPSEGHIDYLRILPFIDIRRVLSYLGHDLNGCFIVQFSIHFSYGWGIMNRITQAASRPNSLRRKVEQELKRPHKEQGRGYGAGALAAGRGTSKKVGSPGGGL